MFKKHYKMQIIYLLLAVTFLVNCNGLQFHNYPMQQMNRPIVGGTEAQIIDIPFQVSLGLCKKVAGDNNKNVTYKYMHFCGGSIISVEWVLTAGHCVSYAFSSGGLSSYRVRVGSNIKNEGGRLHEIAEIRIHPDYVSEDDGIDCDIAVLKMKEPFEFSPSVQSITLSKNRLVTGGIATVSGWGTTTERGDRPLRLQKVQVPIMPQWECRLIYRSELISENMFCAGRAGRSACHGDSGGPVVYDGVQIGIVSWGLSCQRPDYPVVYVNVYNLRDWIFETSGV